MENYFIKLNSVDVNEHKEEKNGLSYLSWAWAWAEVKKQHPEATYQIYEDENGNFYHTDGKTCWVKTGVTVQGIEHIEYLPVMDYRNKSITLDNITSFDVNKSIQRSLTKACARHGLGLYIYAGEDLPEENVPPISDSEASVIKKMLEESNSDVVAFLNYFKVNSVEEMDKKQYVVASKMLNKKIQEEKESK